MTLLAATAMAQYDFMPRHSVEAQDYRDDPYYSHDDKSHHAAQHANPIDHHAEPKHKSLKDVARKHKESLHSVSEKHHEEAVEHHEEKAKTKPAKKKRVQAPKAVTDKHAGIQRHDKLKKPSAVSHHDDEHHEEAHHADVHHEDVHHEDDHHIDVDPYTYYAEEFEGHHD